MFTFTVTPSIGTASTSLRHCASACVAEESKRDARIRVRDDVARGDALARLELDAFAGENARDAHPCRHDGAGLARDVA